jgi:O-acetylhomoserine/O-acetylserine sulfhydrylase-like pyridoxal-dependent enzyme
MTLFMLNLGAIRRWVSKARHRPLYSPEITTVPIYEVTVWTPQTVRIIHRMGGGKYLTPVGTRTSNPTSQCLVTILTALSWLPLNKE